MKAKILSIAMGMMIMSNLLSQNPSQAYFDQVNYIFQNVNKSRITTGLLSDYGLQLSAGADVHVCAGEQ